MLANKSKIECYQYSIDLTEPICFFCNLVLDISSTFVDNFKLEDVFVSDFFSQIQYKFTKDENGVTTASIDEIVWQITSYYNQNIITTLDLSQTDILFIYKPDRLVFSYANDKDQQNKLKHNLLELIKKTSLLEELTQKVKSEKVKEILSKLLSLKSNTLFYKIIQIEDKKPVNASYIPYSFFDKSLISSGIIDESDLISNEQLLRSKLNFSIGEQVNLNIITSNEDYSNQIGIQFNELVFITTLSDLKPLISQTFLSDYYWLLFKEVFKLARNRPLGYSNQLIKDFKLDLKKPVLNKLLTSLRNNHCYDKKFEDENTPFLKYFEEVSTLNNLTGVDNFEFFISEVNNATALGIYTKEKIVKKYNLLHWIKKTENKNEFKYYKHVNNPETKNIKKVFVLKPEIAFYFVTNYFENFLEDIIKSVKGDYIKNFELFTNAGSLGEIDFLIKTSEKFIFIEAKTKLNEEIIDTYIMKCNRLLKHIEPIKDKFKIEFFVIAAYSDSTCENKQFYFNYNKRKNYNVSREGLDCKPYFFNVPIPQNKNAKVTCIAEPEYAKLRSLIRNLCKK